MADETLEDLVRRLTALVVKIDERDDQLIELVEAQRTINTDQGHINDRLTVAIEGINTALANLHSLMREVFRERTNGHTD
jgi:hypothetical protein